VGEAVGWLVLMFQDETSQKTLLRCYVGTLRKEEGNDRGAGIHLSESLTKEKESRRKRLGRYLHRLAPSGVCDMYKESWGLSANYNLTT
jgi:hypothetical protein